jgi:hypothetical protein
MDCDRCVKVNTLCGIKRKCSGSCVTDKPAEFSATPGDAESARVFMTRYGMSPEEARISVDRQKVYGDPWINHLGIAQGIAGILQPWAARIARMDPLPPHVVANIFSALKLNRQRMRFHADNFDDLSVYQRFVRAWQREWEQAGEEAPIVIPPKPHPKARLVIKWEIDSVADLKDPAPGEPRRSTTAVKAPGSPADDHSTYIPGVCHPAD